MSITAILTGYNRPMNMITQLAAVEDQTVPPSDIRVWYNKGEKEPMIDAAGAYCNWNYGVFARFAFALLADTEFVAIFDDDTIPGPEWFANCLDTIKTHDGILGTCGVILSGPTYERHIREGWMTQNETPIEVDLVGHAWFLRRDWIYFMWEHRPTRWDNGEDITLSAAASRHGIKTFVPPHPAEKQDLWGSMHSRLGLDDCALHRRVSWDTHVAQRSEVVRAEIARGWKPLFARDAT